MKKVKITKYGTIHKHAQCENCDWAIGDLQDKNVISKIKKHVLKTGHTVNYETGRSSRFELEHNRL